MLRELPALSVVDLSPIPSGSTAVDALRNTLDLARRADALGYHRYWLAVGFITAKDHFTPLKNLSCQASNTTACKHRRCTMSSEPNQRESSGSSPVKNEVFRSLSEAYNQADKLQSRELQTRTITSLLTLAVAIWTFTYGIKNLQPASSEKVKFDILRTQTEELNSQVSKLRVEFEEVSAKLQVLTKAPGSPTDLQMKSLLASTSQMRTSLQDLEKAVMASPDKALALPLLRRDLDNLKDNQQAAITQVREEVARVYDVTKTFANMVTTLAGSLVVFILGQFAAQFVKGKEEKKAEASVSPEKPKRVGTPIRKRRRRQPPGASEDKKAT